MAARVLGYTQVTWDNLSGEEQQPWSSIKTWASLTDDEKAAAAALGYTQITWDSKTEPQPASAAKSWAELTTCSDGEDLRHASAVTCLACLSTRLVANTHWPTQSLRIQTLTHSD